VHYRLGLHLSILRRLAVEDGGGWPRPGGDIKPKESHVTVTNLSNTAPSVFRSAADLVRWTDVTVIVLWGVVGVFVTTLALSAGFISLLD